MSSPQSPSASPDENGLKSYLEQRYQQALSRRRAPVYEYTFQEFEERGVVFPEGRGDSDFAFIEERSGKHVLMLSLANGLAALRYDAEKSSWRNHHDFLLQENIEEGRQKIETSYRSKFRRAMAALFLANAAIFGAVERDRISSWVSGAPLPSASPSAPDDSQRREEIEETKQVLQQAIALNPTTPEEQVEKLTTLTRLQERIRMLERGLGTGGR